MGMASHLHLGFLVITFGLHDRVVCSLVEQIRAAYVSVKGGHTGTRKDTFSKYLKVGDAIFYENDQRLIKGIIPDMVAASIVKPTLTIFRMIGESFRA